MIAPSTTVGCAAGSWLVYTLLLRALLGSRYCKMREVASLRPEAEPKPAEASQLRSVVENASDRSLAQLLALRAARGEGSIVEKAEERVAWHAALCDLPSPPPGALMPASVRCCYHFAFRDYVNAEELAQMITRRGGLTCI